MPHRNREFASLEALSREELLVALKEMHMLNRELLAEREQETLLQFPWTANLGHWYWNLETGTIVYDQRGLELLGYRREELPKRLIFDFFLSRIHAEDVQRVRDAIGAHLKSHKSVYEVEYRMRIQEDTYLWHYDRGRVTQYDATGKPIFLAGIVLDITEQKKQEQVLRAQEAYDPMTQLYTCARTLAAVSAALTEKPAGVAGGMLVLDVDHFCTVNAVLGQRQGDTILQKIADILRAEQSDGAIAGRVGGDEFLLFFPTATVEQCKEAAGRLQRKIRGIYLDEGQQYYLSVSIGLSVSEEMDSQVILDNAMVALCHAKKLNAQAVVVYETLQSGSDYFQSYPVSEIERDVAWREDIITFTYRTMQQVAGIKNALHVLFSRVARQYAVQSVCVTTVGDHGWTEEVLYLWNDEENFIPCIEKVRLSEKEYQRRARWLAGDAPAVMSPVGLGGVGAQGAAYKGGKQLPQLYCPVYVQGVYQGNVVFAAKNPMCFWERNTIQQMRTVATIFYSTICRVNAENDNNAKTEFLARVGRQVRTPLNTIVSMLEIVRNNAQDVSRMAYCLGKITSSTQYLLSLLNNAMEMTRFNTTHGLFSGQCFELSEILDVVRHLMDGVTAEGPHFLCEKRMLHDTLLGDGGGLQQVLMNLTANAVKFTPKRGCIGLHVRELGEIQPGRYRFLFAVWDTGIGISEKGTERFSKAFYDRDMTFSGLGDGLRAAMRLLASMGSRLQLESEEGKGSRFFFEVEFSEKTESEVSRDVGALCGYSLLIADDSETNVETARDLLESHGARVQIAHDGRQAAQIFEASEPGHFDVVLTDLHMPFLDGVGLARHIRALKRTDANLPIIAATTDIDSVKKPKETMPFFSVVLSKPVDVNRLVRCISSCLHDNRALRTVDRTLLQ